ncbi:MAG: hypothetical protein RL326_1118 [Pseudomonadota bacterium]|jgi:hypothetical protein
MAKKTKTAAKKSAPATTKKSASKRPSTAKKAARSTSARGAKASSKKSAKAAKGKPQAPFITTDQGVKALQYYCEGIMDMIGEYILLRNPKISQKNFTTEAHAMIRGFFGMNEKRASR